MEKINNRMEQAIHSSDTDHTKEELRGSAEEKAKEKELRLPGGIAEVQPEEMKSVIHDLMVHQIELEMQNEELLRLQAELNETQVRYFDIFDIAPVGYLIVSEQGMILETNLTAVRIIGVNRRDLINHRISPFIMKDDQNIYDGLRKALFDTELPQECELRMQKRNGAEFWANLMATVVDNNGIRTARLVISDISLKKKEQQDLIESEEKYRLLCTSMNQGLTLFEIITNEGGQPVDFVFLNINDSFTRLFGYARKDTIGRRVREVVPNIPQMLVDFFGRVALTGEPDTIDNYSVPGGRTYSIYSYSPKMNQFAVLLTNVTDRMAKEDKIIYLSYHDQLTGLYNRRFYEKEMKRLDTQRDFPLSVATGDVNGLKLINDTFGHMAGDKLLKKTAEIIKEGCRADDIIARLGGDEFVIILPKTDSEETAKVIQRIKKLAQKEKINGIELSISFGYETKTVREQDLKDIFKSAEDHMYHHKLKESSSLRGRIIDVIVNILYEKNVREMKHAKRVSELSAAIAAEMNLDSEVMSQIKLAGLLHDIGKIGISEEILNSSHKLTGEEWKQLKKHPEIGYRILSASDEFSDIALFILDHHERWDGNGYPKGLRKEDIPLAARIIAIAEAFDAMTAEDTYKAVMGEDEAQEEIKNCAGRQFDPEIVSILLDKILKSDNDK